MRGDNNDLSHIPGDEGPPLVNGTFAYARDPWSFESGLLARFGAMARTRMFGRTIVLLGAPKLATRVLLDRERTLSNLGGWGHHLGEVFRGGLMLRDFDDHRHHRGIMQAAFRNSARAGYQEHIDRHFAVTVEGWAANRTLMIYPVIKRALLEQAGLAFMGLEPGPHSELVSRWFAAIRECTVTLIKRELPGTKWRRGMVARRELAAFLQAEIPSRRAGAGRDLFTALCRAEDEQGARFDDEAVVDHLIFLLFAAHDTTATALTTLVDELTRAPELQERAAAECLELRDSLNGAGLGGSGLTWDALDRLEYVDRCFREALRVNPPVPYVLRRTVRACPMHEQQLPEGAPTTLVIRAIHQDPELWTEPERFDPERFAPGRAEDRRHPHAWIPFGGGAHRCIGAELARQQGRSFCYHLLTRYRIERVEPRPTPWRQFPLPRPKNDLPVRLHRR